MIETFDYLRSLGEIEDQVYAAIRRTLCSGKLILGPETEAFETEFANYSGSNHCIGVTSGTTALYLALAALDVGPGDEVITVANTCVPTIAAIRQTGASPVLVDVREDDLTMDVEQIEARLTSNVRCIVPVHLWGHATDLDHLLAISAKHNIPVVEDCAQAHGTTWHGRHVGTYGLVGCYSFYPTKNIGAYGDAGAIVTDDSEIAARIRRLREYGYDGSALSQEEGINGRISELQAAILRVKIRVYPEWLTRRLAVARVYNTRIQTPAIRLPTHSPYCRPNYHQYVIRTRARDALASFLDIQGIKTSVHYPTPIHHMPAYYGLVTAGTVLPVTDNACQEILSLPIHESLDTEDAMLVARTVTMFATGNSDGI